MLTYERIKDLCEKKGVTVAQCERDCGFSKGSLCKIEKSKPNLKRLEALARYFGISTDMLIGGENESGYYFDKSTAELAQQIYQNPDLHMLFNATKDASPNELKMFYNMVMVMKKRENEGN